MPGPDISEIKWGTFYDRMGTAHVAPVINTMLMEGHKLTVKCFCSPRIELGKDYQIIVHYVVH